MKRLQQACGLLNFLCICITLGRAFTRHLYAYTASDPLLPHHHVRVNSEMRLDLETCIQFLHHPSAFCRPFMDFSAVLMAEEINFYTDATRNFQLGFRGYCGSDWIAQKWMKIAQSSIQYLELYAVATCPELWMEHFVNR